MNGCQLWELWLEASRVAYSTIVALETPDRLVGVSLLGVRESGGWPAKARREAKRYDEFQLTVMVAMSVTSCIWEPRVLRPGVQRLGFRLSRA